MLLDEVGQSVIGMDGGWRITYWNRASERLYGFRPDEVLGAKITDLPKETLQRLARVGVGLSIDDFGTGYSSLSYLNWLSARTLRSTARSLKSWGRTPRGDHYRTGPGHG